MWREEYKFKLMLAVLNDNKTVRLSQSFRSWAAAASPALPRAVLRSSRVAELVLCSHWASMALSQLTGAPCMRFGLASMFDSSPGRNPRWVPISLHLLPQLSHGTHGLHWYGVNAYKYFVDWRVIESGDVMIKNKDTTMIKEWVHIKGIFVVCDFKQKKL